MIRIQSLTVGPFQSNCHIVACERTGEAVIFDAGDEAPRILATVRAMNVNVKAVINTHAHIDHVSGLAPVVEALGVPVFMHHADVPIYDTLAESAIRRKACRIMSRTPHYLKLPYQNSTRFRGITSSHCRRRSSAPRRVA
jgi:glyoxylase-like metal-dependent hydrolase (beta-lactamase superfamily II)